MNLGGIDDYLIVHVPTSRDVLDGSTLDSSGKILGAAATSRRSEKHLQVL